MILHGHFENGVVVLDGGTPLPDGTPVTIQKSELGNSADRPTFPPIPFPLFQSGPPGSLNITNDQIAEILDDAEVSGGC